MWTKVDMGREGLLAISGYPFQCGLWERRGHLKVSLSSPSYVKVPVPLIFLLASNR